MSNVAEADDTAAEIQEALDAAELALLEYYNGDREWAEAWLLKAMAANKKRDENVG